MSTLAPDPGERIATGVKRLDDLLGGGFPQGSATLVYGPPFIGKEIFTRLFLLEGLRRNEPGVLVLTGASAYDAGITLGEIDADYPRYEKSGLMRFVDSYSKSIGAEDNHPFTEYVDGPMDMNGLSLAVNTAERHIIQEHAHHRLVIDSVSTLMAYTNAQTTFRFLQVFIGKAKRAGASILLLLDRGMHTDAEVQMLKHLCNGVIEWKNEQDRNYLQVQGAGISRNPGWVEYSFTPTMIDVTGSFTAGRIR